MNNSSSDVLLLGLPQTGKSTFIGALYYVLNNPDDIGSDALQLEKLDGDEKYIIGLKDSWLKFKTVKRTSFADEHQTTTFNILNPKTQRTLVLNIPDLSGEVFRRMVEEREKSEALVDLILDAKGYMLFLNCSNYVRATSILSADTLLDEESDEIPKDDNENNTTNWEHKYVPSQVKLIEILQFLLMIKDKTPIKLSLIFSAWDLNEAIFDTPEQFIESQLPMLQQFLKTNNNRINYNIFGVSAQGCNYDKGVSPNDLAKKFADPISRIQVIKGSDRIHDLSLTLRNLIE